jgi:hypothetical protein
MHGQPDQLRLGADRRRDALGVADVDNVDLQPWRTETLLNRR